MKTLYHFTSAQNALNIVSSGKFHLSHASGSGVEEQFNNGKLFFLSTTRSRSNIFATRTAGGSEVMFVLDGDKLKSRYRMFPINFWGSKREHSEAEERLVSDKETIDLGAVISIHANTGLKEEARIRSTGMYLRRLAILAKKQNIPLAFYGSKKDMLSMQPIKRIGLYNDITGSRDGKEVPEPDTRPDFIKQIEKEQKARDSEDMYPFLVLMHMAIQKDFSRIKTSFYEKADAVKYFDMLSNINGFRVRQTVLSEMSRRLMNARHHGGVGSLQMKHANAFILLVKQTRITFNEVPDFIAKRIAETVNV